MIIWTENLLKLSSTHSYSWLWSATTKPRLLGQGSSRSWLPQKLRWITCASRAKTGNHSEPITVASVRFVSQKWTITVHGLATVLAITTLKHSSCFACTRLWQASGIVREWSCLHSFLQTRPHNWVWLDRFVTTLQMCLGYWYRFHLSRLLSELWSNSTTT